jgi:hypothetical protein
VHEQIEAEQHDDQFIHEIHILFEKLDQNYLFQAQTEK